MIKVKVHHMILLWTLEYSVSKPIFSYVFLKESYIYL